MYVNLPLVNLDNLAKLASPFSECILFYDMNNSYRFRDNIIICSKVPSEIRNLCHQIDKQTMDISLFLC